jgi:hypothetical protein
MKQETKGINAIRETQKILLHIVKRRRRWLGKAVNVTSQEKCKFKSFREFLSWLEESSNRQ